MNPSQPLAERMRPRKLDEFVGQDHLIGKNGPLRKIIDGNNLPSMILWGPPGVGKTTLASIIAQKVKSNFYTLSAINSGVKDVREVIERAKKQIGELNFSNSPPVLFIDEIHRFSKSQQDSLLNAVENGTITLIGATTENPSFEVISPLLSRCQVYVLKELSETNLASLMNNAIKEDFILKQKSISLKETQALFRISGGDARKLLNLLELIVVSSTKSKVTVTDKEVLNIAQQNLAIYDKNGEQHYDIISAFIKSIRGSDPNAAVYWLARMTEGGEDPKFIARRMLILASEDIGNANPTAMVLANNCFQAINVIGYPECELILSQTAIYLSTSPKSNASYQAIKAAKQAVQSEGSLPVPLALRNAKTKLSKELGYGQDYKYAHNYDGNFTVQEFLPEELSDTSFYIPGNNAREKEIKEKLKTLWNGKYNFD